MTATPQAPVTGPSPFWPPPAHVTVEPQRQGEIAVWLDEQEAKLVHPSAVREQLRRAGWRPDLAEPVVQQYRRRFNEHSLGYTALLVATGVVALAAGSAGHVLTAGLYQPVNRDALGAWLTIMMCALPFAAWAHWWAARVDESDPVATWSGARRKLGSVLLWSAGIVGIVRLMTYAGQLIGRLAGSSWAAGTPVLAGAINVAITVSIALPLWAWSFRFLHRFDEENPSVPVALRMRSTRPAPSQ
jgi:hypothetical protein